MGSNLDSQLAFTWHAIETAIVGLLGVEVMMGTSRTVVISLLGGLAVVAVIGVIWSWRHLPGQRTTVETNREKTNSTYVR